MKKKKLKKKIKWADVEDLAFILIDKLPAVDPKKLSEKEIKEYVIGLSDFSESAKQSTPEALQAIQARWESEFSEIEKAEEGGHAEETLDEDEYRNDRMIDENVEQDVKEPSKELDLEEGFQEEEVR